MGSRRFSALLLLLLPLACARPASEPAASELEALAPPDLTRVEEAARRQLEERNAAVEAATAGDAEPRKLAAAWGDLGRLYQAYDFTAAALTCYRNARVMAPGDFRWPYYLAFLHQVRGDLEPATELFTAALELRPDDPPALQRLGDVLLELDRAAEAQPLFERLLELDPRSAAALFGLGKIAARSGQPALAVERFERVLELQAGATLVHYPLAQAYRQLGDRERAENHLAQRGNAGPVFADPLVQALDRLAAGAGLRLTRAGVALAEGRTEAALEEYRRAVAADPENAFARVDLGLTLAFSGDLEGARAELSEAVRLDPTSALAHDALGTVLSRAGDDEAAIEHHRRAVELDPGFEDAHFHLGAALAREDRHREAAEAMTRVLERNPQRAAAQLVRATSRLDLGELEAARRDLEDLLGRDPQNARAHLRLGEALQRLGEAGAVDAYARALDIGLEPAEAAAAELSLGNLLAGRGDDAAAAERYRAALAHDATLVGARYNLAGVLARLGRPEEAAACYLDLVELEPENVNARLYLAEALLAAGKAAEARARLEEGLAALPQSVPLAYALARTLAASPDRAARDGARAVDLALQVLRAEQRLGRPRLEHAETVAMAFAEAGDFGEAVRWQRQVVAGAEEAGAPASDLAALRRHLALYEHGEACCGTAATSPPAGRRR